MPRVNPDILRWARESAGLSRAAAADRLGLRVARGVQAIDRLVSLEEGRSEPTRAMLVKMAKQYRRPLLTFYLANPPVKGDRGQDFRRLPDEAVSEDEPLLDALIRDVIARKGMVRAALEDEDEAQPLPFIGSVSSDVGVERVVERLRETIGLSLADFRAARGADEAFRLLRTNVENTGVFVLLLGNLGSHHSNIDAQTFRGFALADDVAPFIIINDQDSRAAWAFTLLHELVHLWLGQTGVSGAWSDHGIERFCNDVASEYLLPASELAEILPLPSGSVEEKAAGIDAFARERNISRSMVAYRLYRSGAISEGRWSALNRHFRDRWREERTRRRERRPEEGGGPDYYVVRRHRLGSALVEATARLLAAGALTTTKAARILGVKPKQIGTLIGESGSFGPAS